MPEYQIRVLPEHEFESCSRTWQECLRESAADPVFASWPWCYSWWRTWSEIHDLEWNVLVVEHAGRTVGIVPLYAINVNRKFGLRGRQLQLIGGAWRTGPAVRTEHTGFIISKNHEVGVYAELAGYLRTEKWKDIVICDHDPSLLQQLEKLGVSAIVRSRDRGVRLDVTGSFDHWISSLGKNTRLKVYNRRNYLEGRFRLENIPCRDMGRRSEFLDLLNSLHQHRRSQGLSAGETRFHHCLAEHAGNEIKPVYSVLLVDNEIVSALYDIEAGDRRYNLQSVFREDFDKKVSPGLLHLGFAVEDAFRDNNIHIYDFLAGKGKKTFYKERLKGATGDEYRLLTTQVSKTWDHYLYLKGHMLARSVHRLATGAGTGD